MIVSITDYGQNAEGNFIEYSVSGLSQNQLVWLDENLEDETVIEDDMLVLTMYFDDGLYPFQSDVAKFRMDDFISREEIEMNLFLSSFLEDM